VGGWPILIVGIVSIAAGASYTSGPFPIAYSGLGELFVCVFFGLVAVAGSYYLQTGVLSPAALLSGLMLGLLAAAVLVVNNYRDLDNDKQVGKNTLAVRMGRAWTRGEYAVLMLLPFALSPGLYALNTARPGSLLPLVLLPWALKLIKRFRGEPPGLVFNQLLAATARLQLAFSVVLCLGLSIFDS
jgi:1,4-dihydroxy-2-naphthoate octaprenyltransferase